MTTPSATTGERLETVIDVPGGWCLAVLDRPPGPCRAAIVCAHGLTGDRSGPADLLARWAGDLAGHGFATVRFDLRGSGESSGDFADTTFAGMVSDFCAAAAWAIEVVGPRPVIAAGISIGGVPAALASGMVNSAATLLISSDLIEGIRFDTDTITPIRGGEFHLPAAFFREREGLYPRRALSERGKPWGLIFGGRDSKLLVAAGELRQLGAWVAEVSDTDHLFESVPARAALMRETLRFLDHALADG
ncbi:MAG TPA: alpha/beta fold hydrolase [Micromonosporaceae bacterium]|nr:alpha/beta fold hydrolase [Micromonosporaceae bacterium]